MLRTSDDCLTASFFRFRGHEILAVISFRNADKIATQIIWGSSIGRILKLPLNPKGDSIIQPKVGASSLYFLNCLALLACKSKPFWGRPPACRRAGGGARRRPEDASGRCVDSQPGTAEAHSRGAPRRFSAFPHPRVVDANYSSPLGNYNCRCCTGSEAGPRCAQFYRKTQTYRTNHCSLASLSLTLVDDIVPVAS